MSDTAEEQTAARDFVMARLAAARGQVAFAAAAIDEALQLFVDPDADTKGKERRELIDGADAALADAARAVQIAGAELDAIDPTEGEPEEDAVDDEDDDEEEEEDEDRPRRKRR